MLRTDDLKSGTRSYTLGNFRTLLLISYVYKIKPCVFHSRHSELSNLYNRLRLIGIAATSKGLLFIDTPCIDPLQSLTRSKNLHAMKEFGRY